MNEGNEKSMVFIYLLLGVGCLAIYWYWSKRGYETLERALGNVPRTGATPSNGATAPAHESAGGVLFPKAPPEG